MGKINNIILHIDGGFGKHIMSTAVINRIHKKHPDKKIIVVCGYPEIFINIKHIHRVYKHGSTPYFYQDYIETGDSIVLRHEPYHSNDHINKKKHIIHTWCDLYGLGYEKDIPEIVLNSRQNQIAMKTWLRDKPILLMQTNGGPLNGNERTYKWTRDIPMIVAKKVVERYKNHFHIIQICRSEENAIDGCESITRPMLNSELISILPLTSMRLLNDSCLQHASAAFGMKSTVLWIGTQPNIFGYDINDNIIADIGNVKLPDSYLFDYSFDGVTHECPIMDMDTIFNYEDIFKSLESQLVM